MPPASSRKDLNLKSLELFQTCARLGTLLAAAEETGLSVSTVSHHIRSLEAHLGIALFNHARRPMTLTPKGRVFLRNIDDALLAIRKAQSEALTGDITSASYLRLGSIEDFDSDVTPDLAVYLSQHMPECDFLYHTDSSHEIIEMVRNRHLDMGIASSPSDRLRDLEERPLLKDPFVVITPRTQELDVSELISGRSNLPFLRFTNDLIVSRQIEAQLKRLGVRLPNRFECGNTQTLMAMVAAGAGWTITTPLMFSRAQRFQNRLRLHRFPGKQFARTLSLLWTPDCSRSLRDLVDQRLRSSLTQQVLAPAHQRNPWLSEQFALIA